MSDMYGQPIVLPEKKQRRKWVTMALASVLALVILVCTAIAGVVGWNLTHPQREPVLVTPEGMRYQDVQFFSRLDDTVLRGWLIEASDQREQIVIFAHGYGANRSKEAPIMPTARALYDQGIDSLLFDFRNSGESEGTITSVGQFEKADLLSAIQFCQDIGYKKIGLIGFSMGAATSILAAAESEGVIALVADSPFSDLRGYLQENLPVWSNLPSFPFTPLVLGVTPLLTGLKPSQVRPVKAIAELGNKPVLLIHSEGDDKIPVWHSQVLYDTAARPTVNLWVTGGTKHLGSYQADPEAYTRRVSEFFQQHLQ